MRPDITGRVHINLAKGEYLEQLIAFAQERPVSEPSFSSYVSQIANDIREILEGANAIRTLAYQPSEFWSAAFGKQYGFVDGGVSSSESTGIATSAVKVASYVVRPGDISDQRESFLVESLLLVDAFDASMSIFEGSFDSLERLTSATRILAELSGVLNVIQSDDVEFCLLHGPLINPASPYSLSGMPKFRKAALEKLFAVSVPDEYLNFPSAYAYVARYLNRKNAPVIGVIERPGKGHAFMTSILKKSDETQERLMRFLDRYMFSDTDVFSLVLNAGEYIAPMDFNRQGDRNSQIPEKWMDVIKSIPSVSATYLKPSMLSNAIRVESFPGQLDEKALLFVLHASRLLPSYQFPAGLDIVDKYAKIPAWLTKATSRERKSAILQEAIEDGNPAGIESAIRSLSISPRDWLYRPKA